MNENTADWLVLLIFAMIGHIIGAFGAVNGDILTNIGGAFVICMAMFIAFMRDPNGKC